VTLLVLGLLFWWRKRKQRLENEEQRKQELDDYSYTPHADPTIPAIGGQYVPKESQSGGYRGWGTTMPGSGRNGSATLSGGFSDATSPTQVADAPMAGVMSSSPTDGEIMGSMGAAGVVGAAAGAHNNHDPNGDVHRGPSNASSQYSTAGRSDASDGIGVAYGSGAAAPPYYESYHVGGPYDPANGSPPRPSDLLNGQQQQAAMPVIRDNPARRNPRIESPAHYPQQTGISQNF
jgi:hypothetical protein